MAEDMSFEEALTKLEETVAQLEQGDALTLDASLQAFEGGVRLARLCRQKLDQAELRVQQLIETDGDGFIAVPFETEDDLE